MMMIIVVVVVYVKTTMTAVDDDDDFHELLLIIFFSVPELLRDPSTEKSSVSVKKWLGNVAQVFKVALVKKVNNFIFN